MNKYFGTNKDRKSDEESYMHFNVMKKGNPADARRRGTEGGEYQQR
jgi:hypothetical protein